MTVRTRFAPSPTGYLHIGGVRTALFCWLFARRHGGRFILRIDDTDQQRNVEEALRPILEGLRWLGIEWDEGPEVGGPHLPYFQSQRSARYRAAVERLLEKGLAYRDFARPEEVQEEREAALAEKRPFVYSRRYMAENDAEAARFEGQGRKGVVRLKMPREGKLVIDDLVRGPVEFEWAAEQDHVVQRTDGSCLYHLASVVDDAEMGITHVIRAEEHLSNTPRQVFIARGLGYEEPACAHLPFVAEPGSKTKLSKRKLAKYLKGRDFAQMVEHGRAIAARLGIEVDEETFNPVVVDFYRTVGYLPEAIVNYLALLGWSLDDRTDHFTGEALVESFSLERVNRSPAAFDPQKLRAFQDRHMQAVPVERKVALVLPFLEQAGWVASPPSDEVAARLARIVEALGDRLKVAGDILDYRYFFTADEALSYDEKAFAKRVGAPGAAELLADYRGRLAEIEPFDAASLEAMTKQFVADRGLGLGAIVHAGRLAVTGSPVGPGLFDCLEIVGREGCLRRIDRALARVAEKP